MKIIIPLLILMIGCSTTTGVERSYRNSCLTVSDRKVLADFILQCARNANPMSDEEGEDLVIQCERTGLRTICPSSVVCRNWTEDWDTPKIYGPEYDCEVKK